MTTELLCLAVASNDPAPCVLAPCHPGPHQDDQGVTWRHGHKYGPPDVYEITWMSGHIERVLAHQVTYPSQRGMALAAMFGNSAEPAGVPRVLMHGEINGHWLLVLSALEADIRTIRLVTADEPIPGGAA